MTTSLVRRITKFFGFKIINYDFPRWHTAEWENWDSIDALLNVAGIINVKGVWANNTSYVVGNRLIDSELGTIWQCAVNHVSPATGAFAAARTVNPTYWTAFSTLPNYRGAWVTGAEYAVGDIVQESSYKFYYCTVTHTASALFATDAGKWSLSYDSTPAVDAVAAIYDTFDDRYLGAKAVAPTVDNDGNALLIGAMYFNTTSNDSWIWNGTIWVSAVSVVPDNSITTVKLVNNILSADAPGRAKMADGFLTGAKLATGASAQEALRTALGANDEGSDIFIGATPIGLELATATTEAIARAAIDAESISTTSTGVGQYVAITTGAGNAFVLPAGGTWSWAAFGFNSAALTIASGYVAGVSVGGSTVVAGAANTIYTGFAKRLT